MERKDTLVKLVERMIGEEEKFGALFGETEGGAAGLPEQWTAKDHLAHVAVWKKRLAMRLEAAIKDEPIPAFDGDIDEMNREIFKDYRDAAWQDVLELAVQANRQLIDLVQSLTEKQIESADLLPNTNNRPVWRMVVGNACIHAASLHLSRYYLDNGQSVRAAQLEEDVAELMSEVDDSPGWRGLLQYNLACFQAQTGKIKKTLETLRVAFSLTPELKEYSTQDSDLDPIRQEPDYLAFFSE